MSALAYKKQSLDSYNRYERIGYLRAQLYTIGDLEVTLPDILTKWSNKNIKVIVVHDERDQHIVAFLPIIDSRDSSASYIHSTKFNYEALLAQCGQDSFLEIGEVEVLDERQSHRARALIWQLVYQYCSAENIGYIIGCIAFSGRYPAIHAVTLSYLYHFHRCEPALIAPAYNGVTMDIMPKEAIRANEARSLLPAQLRYCLRHGAKVGTDICVDTKTNQCKIFVLMPVGKYLTR